MANKSGSSFDPAEINRLAQSPTGKQLMQLLQENKGKELSEALEKAGVGDYSKARSAINDFLATPEAQQLLKKLQEEQHG